MTITYEKNEVYRISRPAEANAKCQAVVPLARKQYRPCNAWPTRVRSRYFVCMSHARSYWMFVPHMYKENPVAERATDAGVTLLTKHHLQVSREQLRKDIGARLDMDERGL